MDDYGRPLGDPSPDDDDGPRYSVTNDDDNDNYFIDFASDTMLVSSPSGMSLTPTTQLF